MLEYLREAESEAVIIRHKGDKSKAILIGVNTIH